MAEFLTTSGIASEIEKVILNAEKELTLVSPYLQLSNNLLQRLQDANHREVHIRIVYGKDELAFLERKHLDDLDNLELFFLHNLHAKCYFNEERMVITSMNMYEYSERNNREMGVLVNAKKDQELYHQAVSEAESIIRFSETMKSIKRHTSYNQKSHTSTKNDRGFCIRCEASIPKNIEKPYCYSCYAVWITFSNPDYLEQVCHTCGQTESTSMNKPQCVNCWKVDRKGSFIFMRN